MMPSVRADDEDVTAIVGCGQIDRVFGFDFGRIGQRIGDIDRMAKLLQAVDQVEASAVAQVRHVFLEGQAEDQCLSRLAAPPFMQGVGDPATHIVGRPPSGEDHQRIVIQPLC